VLATYRFAVDLGATIGPFMLASLLGFTDFTVTIVVSAGLLLVAAVVVSFPGLAPQRKITANAGG
jgi:uncharacterized membrane protein YesL